MVTPRGRPGNPRPGGRVVSTAKAGYARLPFAWLEDEVFTDVLSPGAFRLRVLMTAHCAYDLTDGWVSERLVRSLVDEPESLAELLRLGYLEQSVREERGVQIEGYRLAGFEEEQMSREQRLAEREAARNRMRNVRASRKGNGVRANVRANVQGNGSRTAPERSPRSSSDSSSGSGRDPVVARNDDLALDLGQGATRRQDGSNAPADVVPPANRQQTIQADNRHSDSGGRFVLPATPFRDSDPPPRGKPAESGGSGNFGQPLRASQAEALLVARISPERFVRQMRSKADQKGWEHLDWNALVAKQRFVKTLAVRQGEVDALLPQVEAWLAEGAE